MSLTKILDVAEDIAEYQEELVEVLKNLKLPTPQTTITTPPPTVNVSATAPVVNVAAPKPLAPVSWEFTVTKRDAEGLIVKFTATPSTHR